MHSINHPNEKEILELMTNAQSKRVTVSKVAVMIISIHKVENSVSNS